MRGAPGRSRVRTDLASRDLWRCVPDFLDEMERIRQIAPNTREAYQRDLDVILTTLADGRPEVPVAAWHEEALQRVVEALCRTAYSPRSVERMLSTWRQFSHYLMRLELIDDNPAKGLVAPPFVIRPPAHIDRERLLAALDSLTGEDERALRDRVILELICGCGLRVSELAELRVGDIRDGELVVGSRSPRARARILTLPSRVAERARQYIEAVHGTATSTATPLLLGLNRRQVSERTIQRAISLRLSELADGMRVTAESLRQSFLLWLLEDGLDIEVVHRLAGHKRLASTQRYADHSARPNDDRRPRQAPWTERPKDRTR